jgi:metal-responsive CopG/Arc/MetJ family transcriptional regulator
MGVTMAKRQKGGRPPTGVKTARASVSLPMELHDTLEQIAKQKKVSFAWVIRDAAEKYVADQWPLFEQQKP